MPKLNDDYLRPLLASVCEETKADYGNIMKKFIFDMSILTRANIGLFSELNLPLSIVFSQEKVRFFWWIYFNGSKICN